MIRVIHLQYLTTTASPGNRLHNAFLNEGIDSNILSLYSDINESENIKSLTKKGKWISKLNNEIESILTRNKNPQFGEFSFPIIGSNIAHLDQVKRADIIYVHWVLNGFLSLNNIEQLVKLNKPIIFFMHDMWTITGGCHHSFECDKYKVKCHNCQFFPVDKNKDLSTIEFNQKLKIFSKYDNLSFIAPSKWLYDCAKQSALIKDKSLFYIPNILDDKIFKPINQEVAKHVLNIKSSEFVIAFGAISINSPYKGWKYLQKALELLYEDENYRNIKVLIFGSGYSKEVADAIPFETEFVGFLNNEYATTLVYNAADVFVAPSVAEVFGYVVLESLCCGTPVVAFKTGGIPDLISHKDNGYLANCKDPSDLAIGIKYCLDHKIKGYRLPCFEPQVVAKQHIDLMNKVMYQEM